MPIITICSSANFYQQAVAIQAELEQRAGYTVVVPDMATAMKESGDFEVSHYKTWFADPGDYTKKAELIHGHFDKVAAGDAILVLNFEKNGVENYIGGNVLMEMGLAFHLQKPIFIFNDAPKESSYEEEILGMLPIFLNGDISRLPGEYEKLQA